MRYHIDPKIDCVFKALLGSEDNRRLLIHFINAILAGELLSPITEVIILDPYNEREFLDDKLSIVDVKARDEQGRLYQIEIQLLSVPDLPARICYTWADLYSQQLHSGEDYGQLRPTYAIWILAEDMLRDDPAYAHRYRLCDERGRRLIDHGGIWLMELNKFAAEVVETEEQRWLKFFIEGERLDDADLPDWMQTAEMRQAMSTLKAFSEKEHAYHAYQARQNYLRQQRSIQRVLEEERAAREAERRAKEAERQAKEAALREMEVALREMEVALREMEAERQAKEVAVREKEAAEREKESAQSEVEHLKALLRDRMPPAGS
jgi:predicted transposase/invertase (TIGR01784 family)